MKIFFFFICVFWGVCSVDAAGTDPAVLRTTLVQQADRQYVRMNKPNARYGIREVFSCAYAIAEAKTNLTRLAECVRLMEALQERDPQARAYGNFLWYSTDAAIVDFNAVDFCMQYGAMLWKFHQDKFEPAVRARFQRVLELGLQGLLRHRVRSTYTNIALLNAADLILLGEVLGDAHAVEEGYQRLLAFASLVYEEGLHEFVSPTYYGVDIESLLVLEALTAHTDARSAAQSILEFIWTDVALNWYAPAQRLGGSQSRTYDYTFGFGALDPFLVHAGWLVPDKKFRLLNGLLLYTRWQPSSALRAMNTHYPRWVTQRWGEEALRARSFYACKDVALGVSWRNYHGRMDIPLAVDFPSPSRDVRQPRVSFIPDARHDPYGSIRIAESAVHMKALHQSCFWTAAQEKSDAVALAIYRPSDFKDSTGTLESHLLLPATAEVWVNDAKLAVQPTNRLPIDAAIFVRLGSGVMAVRIPFHQGHTEAACTLELVRGDVLKEAMRLSVVHPVLPTNCVAPQVAGVGYFVRIGSDMEDAARFAAFRNAFRTLRIEASVTPAAVQLRVPECALSVCAQAPFTVQAQTSPRPPKTVLALDNKELGKPILARIPVLAAWAERNASQKPIRVHRHAPTTWEAEAGLINFFYEVATNDQQAANGAYLWEPEEEHGRVAGSGQARYLLELEQAGDYTLSGRVLSPTPEDDSFFVSILNSKGEVIVPETAWSLGVHRAWTWRMVTPPRSREPQRFALPAGNVTLLLKTREAGTKIDQLRLTPVRP